MATNNAQSKVEVFGLSSLRRTRHLSHVKDVKRQYVSQMIMRQQTTPRNTKPEKYGICIGTCYEDKNSHI